MGVGVQETYSEEIPVRLLVTVAVQLVKICSPKLVSSSCAASSLEEKSVADSAESPPLLGVRGGRGEEAIAASHTRDRSQSGVAVSSHAACIDATGATNVPLADNTALQCVR